MGHLHINWKIHIIYKRRMEDGIKLNYFYFNHFFLRTRGVLCQWILINYKFALMAFFLIFCRFFSHFINLRKKIGYTISDSHGLVDIHKSIEINETFNNFSSFLFNCSIIWYNEYFKMRRKNCEWKLCEWNKLRVFWKFI